MVDKLTSERMRKVKSKRTKLELHFASLLRKNKIKYRSQPSLFGKPDFRIKSTNVLIFCDSSFWHGRNEDEITGKAFKKNRSFWMNKLLYNKARDERTNRFLRKRGWVVLRFWDEDILKRPSYIMAKIGRYDKKINGN